MSVSMMSASVSEFQKMNNPLNLHRDTHKSQYQKYLILGVSVNDLHLALVPYLELNAATSNHFWHLISGFQQNYWLYVKIGTLNYTLKRKIHFPWFMVFFHFSFSKFCLGGGWLWTCHIFAHHLTYSDHYSNKLKRTRARSIKLLIPCRDF